MNPGVQLAFILACLIAVAVPLLKDGLKTQLSWRHDANRLSGLKVGLGTFLVLYGLGWLLQQPTAGGIPYFLTGFALSWGLGGMRLSPGIAGIVLLLVAFMLFPLSSSNAEPSVIPSLSYLFGLTAASFFSRPDGSDPNERLIDWAIPALWLTGSFWISQTSPDNWLVTHQSLLLVFLSLALLLRALLRLDWLPEKNPVIPMAFTVLVGALAGWLAVQNVLFQPSLLNWAWLFAGGLLLAFLLDWPLGEEADESGFSLRTIITLVLIGIGTLVASRLFGTLGWLVLASALLVRNQPSSGLNLAMLFLVTRSLLQGFIQQYNPNLTGINLVHPYAGAALYAGFILMLLLPVLFKRGGDRPFGWALILAGGVILAALGNYFLHSEAMSSLLVALTVAGVGVSALGFLPGKADRSNPLMLAVFLINGALLTNGLIDAGNEAERTQKIMVLAAGVLLFALLFWLGQRGDLRRKPVEVV